MTKLSVNINKFATLRNARGGNNPDIQQVTIDIQNFGAEGVTVHPRPDERHIRYQDVLDIAPLITTEFNIEGYPDRQWLDLVLKVKPTQATLVPDAPNVLTSNAGWDTIKHQTFLKEVVTELKNAGIRVSLFTDTSQQTIEGAAKTGTDRIELYTEPYAHHFNQNPLNAVNPYKKAAEIAHSLGLGINAGHDLSLENLYYFHQSVPHLLEVSIGHALVCDALYLGLENTIQLYLRSLRS
ncbi:MAG: pyridoxine 5'-phosphate synthase [Raineya sp.]|jgi:pyridoxine 5-phosphate synthase|nr:pyridoxine 5'-phosphate synthase [Raineya sp.]